MSIIDRARTLRTTIENLAETLDNEAALEAVELFPYWQADTEYTTGKKVRYLGVLYKVLQNHTSQADWTPDTAVSLYARVLTSETEILVWEQPDSTNPYMKGDKVHYPTTDDPVYESTIDNNVWSPRSYPAAWTLVQE